MSIIAKVIDKLAVTGTPEPTGDSVIALEVSENTLVGANVVDLSEEQDGSVLMAYTLDGPLALEGDVRYIPAERVAALDPGALRSFVQGIRYCHKHNRYRTFNDAGRTTCKECRIAAKGEREVKRAKKNAKILERNLAALGINLTD